MGARNPGVPEGSGGFVFRFLAFGLLPPTKPPDLARGPPIKPGPPSATPPENGGSGLRPPTPILGSLLGPEAPGPGRGGRSP